MTDRDLLKQALEALEEINKLSIGEHAICLPGEIDTAMDALRERLAQPEQSPLDRMAENARELGLDYEPVQEPVAGRPLPCPFCGGDELSFSDGSTHRWGIASCASCGATAGETRREYPDKGEWHEDAIHNWNQRTAPPRREWVGLTKEEAKEISLANRPYVVDMIAALEARLKEKNNAD